MDNLNNHINSLRRFYKHGTLSKNDVNKLPYLQFETWIQQAIDAKVLELSF
jgi:pyridoxine/pyridoxamine 5'-phosphate oxidase